MRNKRTLKQSIRQISEELFAECVAASLYGAKGNSADAEALLFSIVRMQDDFLARISHPEPGMPAKVYYKNLREKFAIQASEILDQVNNH